MTVSDTLLFVWLGQLVHTRSCNNDIPIELFDITAMHVYIHIRNYAYNSIIMYVSRSSSRDD